MGVGTAAASALARGYLCDLPAQRSSIKISSCLRPTPQLVQVMANETNRTTCAFTAPYTRNTSRIKSGWSVEKGQQTHKTFQAPAQNEEAVQAAKGHEIFALFLHGKFHAQPFKRIRPSLPRSPWRTHRRTGSYPQKTCACANAATPDSTTYLNKIALRS